MGGDQIYDTCSQKCQKEKNRRQSDTKDSKTECEKKRIIDAKYMYSDDLFQKIEYKYNNTYFEEEPQKAISKSKIQKKIQKTRQ